MTKKKLVLAYSGGLDTTYCAVHLAQDLGYEVHAITVNTGAFSTEDIHKIEERAASLGVASYKCVDVREAYYEQAIKFLIFGNVLKNGTYPLSVSAERVVQAISVAKYAQELGATTIAHGSTGAGNDQVRFDMIFEHLIPGVEIITPIRDNKLSRQAEIEYLHAHGVEIDAAKAAYSINKGLWGTSVGGKETLTSHSTLPEEAWPTPVTETEAKDITLHFNKGELVQINDKKYSSAVEAIEDLQALAQPFGIGRDVHVGDTIIGIKGRVGFEAAAPVLIIKAHHLLEKHTLTKWQLFFKEQLATFYGNWMHEGQMLDPVMRDIEAFLQNSQDVVSGKVFITLMPHRFMLNGIESEHDLLSAKHGSYGEMNTGWSGEDVRGFAKIFGLQTSIYHQINKDKDG